MPFHVTPAVNVPRILKEGLVPQIGARSGLMEQEDGVYLFRELADVGNALDNWLEEEFDEDEKLSLLEVTVPPGANTLPTTADYEVVVADPIPPKYIKVLYADLDEVSL